MAILHVESLMMDASSHLAERRRAIIAAAEKLFDANGYAATTVDAVAAEAGIAKGSVYNYFSSKQDLFASVFAEAIAGDEADIETLVVEPIPASEKLERLLDYWLARVGEYKRIGRLVLEFWTTAARDDREGEFAAAFKGLYDRARGRIAAILDEGIQTGEFGAQSSPDDVVSLIMACMDGIVVQSILDVGVTVDSDFMTALKRTILASVMTNDE